jgi:hypothetical protein
LVSGGAYVRGKFCFKGGRLLAEDIPTAIEDTMDGGVKFGLERQILSP